MAARYSQEQLDFLEAGFKRCGVDQLTAEFNQRYAACKTPAQIRSTLKNHGFRCGRKQGDLARGRYKLVTAEQAKWLRDQYPKLSRDVIADEFNRTFGTALTHNQVVTFLKNNGIKCGRSGRFGTRPGWNAGLAGTGVCKPNKGSFKPGDVPANEKPLYSERVGKDGYIEVKVPIPNPYTKAKTRWIYKQRWIWMQAHGDIPRGSSIVFKDGDNRSFDLGNLACVTRRQLSILNTRGYFSAPDELKPAIWQLVALEVAVLSKEMADGGKSQRELVMDALQEPRTSAEIAELTGVRREQVSTLLCQLSHKGVAVVSGRKKNPHGRSIQVWKASNQQQGAAASSAGL